MKPDTTYAYSRELLSLLKKNFFLNNKDETLSFVEFIMDDTECALYSLIASGTFYGIYLCKFYHQRLSEMNNFIVTRYNN